MKQSDTSAQEEYTGKFFKRIYRNGDGSYCVCHYIHNRETTTVVGSRLPEVPYEVTFVGRWANNATYGRQFLAAMVVQGLPADAEGICKFVESLRCGIGIKRCRPMVEKVGAKDFWHTLQTDPTVFTEVPGVKMKHLLRLKEAVTDLQLQSELVHLFDGILPLTTEQFKAIQKLGAQYDVIGEFKKNPYFLMRCGYCFGELDRYAIQKTVRALDSPDRLFAAAYQCLMDARTQSHVALPKEVLSAQMRKLLAPVGAVSEESLESYLRCCQPLVSENGLYYLPRSFEEEATIADYVDWAKKEKVKPLDKKKYTALLAKYSSEKGIVLSAEQQAAVWMALNSRFSIITGGPGTGKSTIMDALLYCWRELCGGSFLLMAPTGKAAVRMTETTGEPASTIHSALGLHVKDEDMTKMTDYGNPVEQSLVVIDEASMLDQTVMCAVVQAMNRKKGFRQHLVMIGDPDQLPSVGWGNILGDLISSGAVPVTRLSCIYRQGENSPIITNALRIQENNPELDWSNRSFRHYNYGNNEENMEAVCKFYCRCIAQFGIENVLLLSPYRKATAIGTNIINAQLQNVVNPAREGQAQISHMGRRFRVNDRVIQLKNTEVLTNGTLGTITMVNPGAGEGEYCLEVAFEGGVTYGYVRDELTMLDHAYALSVHKSQGSQATTVLVILPANPNGFLRENLRRNMLYTAITRAQKNVAIFAPTKTISECIHNYKTAVRHTGLVQRLN